jgi:osmoprotectant transport system substrate-binding protein
VASKGYTEQIILGKMMVYLLKDRGIPVVDRTSLGGTLVCRQALEQGQIDIYMEYTGTAWIEIFKEKETIRDPMALYEKVKAIDSKNGLVWLSPARFNNTYAIVMRSDKAEEMGIQSISDWAEWSKQHSGEMTFATNAEFYSRTDGFKGLMTYYGLTLGKEIPDGNVKKMETPLCKKAVRDHQVLSGMAFATDGEIQSYHLVALTDDKSYFPIYNPAPVVRQSIIDQYPEITEILGEIGPSLDTGTMSRLNYRVNVNGEKPDAVAQSWLRGVGLVVRKRK